LTATGLNHTDDVQAGEGIAEIARNDVRFGKSSESVKTRPLIEPCIKVLVVTRQTKFSPAMLQLPRQKQETVSVIVLALQTASTNQRKIGLIFASGRRQG
jgi:hypothetical protein